MYHHLFYFPAITFLLLVLLEKSTNDSFFHSSQFSAKIIIFRNKYLNKNNKNDVFFSTYPRLGCLFQTNCWLISIILQIHKQKINTECDLIKLAGLILIKITLKNCKYQQKDEEYGFQGVD